MTGRKPIPTLIKRLQGDGIHDSGGRLILDSPEPTQGAPDVPEELSGDALTAWHSFISDTEAMGIITHADRAALIMLCKAWAEMQCAERHIEHEGAVITLKNGYLNPNPYCTMRDKASTTVLKLLGEFGMTPSTRSRIRIAPTETVAADDFAELRAG